MDVKRNKKNNYGNFLIDVFVRPCPEVWASEIKIKWKKKLLKIYNHTFSERLDEMNHFTKCDNFEKFIVFLLFFLFALY